MIKCSSCHQAKATVEVEVHPEEFHPHCSDCAPYMVGLVRDVYKGRVASTRPFEQPPEVEAPPKPAKEPPKEVSDENTTEVKKTRRGRKPKSSELVPEKLPEPLTPVTPKVANVDEVPIPKWANMEDIFGFSDE